MMYMVSYDGSDIGDCYIPEAVTEPDGPLFVSRVERILAEGKSPDSACADLSNLLKDHSRALKAVCERQDPVQVLAYGTALDKIATRLDTWYPDADCDPHTMNLKAIELGQEIATIFSETEVIHLPKEIKKVFEDRPYLLG